MPPGELQVPIAFDLRADIFDSLLQDDGISMNIEHGPEHNNINAEYETTTFYYAPSSDLWGKVES